MFFVTTVCAKFIGCDFAKLKTNGIYTIVCICFSDGYNRLLPKPNEIVFSCPPPTDKSHSSATEEYGNWGSMSWCYPHPRVLTLVAATPIPLHLATSPDEPFDEDRVEEVSSGFIRKLFKKSNLSPSSFGVLVKSLDYYVTYNYILRMMFYSDEISNVILL